jgi:hypothetical protein
MNTMAFLQAEQWLAVRSAKGVDSFVLRRTTDGCWHVVATFNQSHGGWWLLFLLTEHGCLDISRSTSFANEADAVDKARELLHP